MNFLIIFLFFINKVGLNITNLNALETLTLANM